MKAQDVYKRITGTGKQAELLSRQKTIVEVFGNPEPLYESMDGKVKCIWVIQTPYGVGTIYDYKSQLDPQINTRWSIGGKNKKTGEYILNKMLKKMMEGGDRL